MRLFGVNEFGANPPPGDFFLFNILERSSLISYRRSPVPYVKKLQKTEFFQFKQGGEVSMKFKLLRTLAMDLEISFSML
jgi:hypothetical protein